MLARTLYRIRATSAGKSISTIAENCFVTTLIRVRVYRRTGQLLGDGFFTRASSSVTKTLPLGLPVVGCRQKSIGVVSPLVIPTFRRHIVGRSRSRGPSSRSSRIVAAKRHSCASAWVFAYLLAPAELEGVASKVASTCLLCKPYKSRSQCRNNRLRAVMCSDFEG